MFWGAGYGTNSFDGAKSGEGSGGAAGSIDGPNTITNRGGAGIDATGGNVTVVTSGSIAGGSVGYDAGISAEGISNAISFGGDNNTLELQSGFSFTGNVVCTDGSATNNKLALGGTVDSTFDVSQLGTDSYQGFNVYQKKGASTWRLSNSTTVNTPWTLTEGTLEISYNGALGDASAVVTFDSTGEGILKIGNNLSGPIGNTISFVGDGTINTNGYNAVVSQPIAGSGRLIKSGAGILELSTVNTSFTGPVLINNGGVRINGNFPVSRMTIMRGAQLTSTGAIDFDPTTSVYTCEIDSLGNTGRINTDTAQLGGNVYVIPQAGDYSAAITYTILEATSGITGDFESVTGSSPFLSYKLNRVVNRIDLTVSPLSSPFKNIAKEGNTGLMAQYIDGLGNIPSNSSLKSFENALITLSTTEVQEALNQLHPGPNNSVSSSVMTDQFNRMDNVMSFSFTDRNSSLINTQLNGIGVASNQLTPQVTPINRSGRSRGDSHFGKPFRFSELYIEGAANNPSMSQPMRTTVGGTTLWVQQTGSYSNQESMADGSSTIGIAGVKSTLTDTSVGADTLVAENLRLGATVGYGKTLYQLRQDYGKGRINTYRLGLYGIWQLAKNWYINVSAFYGCQDFKGKRTLTLTGVKHTNSQSHKGYNVGAMAEVGRDVAITKELTLTPYAGLGGLSLHEDQYSEKAEGLNPGLTVHKHNNHLIQGKTGIQVSQVFKINEMPFYFYGKLGYTYRKHLQNSHRIKASFTGYSGSFTMVTPNKGINMVNPGVGGSVLLDNNISLTANYNAELSSKLHIHQATLNLTYRF
ncbi:MAG: autotransporter domain-containing protein [Candidatus Paracaedibacteraceae bacterium]|nr:autotransporter domain-containing protein [Candidatus Paracaedibacteraceae bacterium]